MARGENAAEVRVAFGWRRWLAHHALDAGRPEQHEARHERKHRAVRGQGVELEEEAAHEVEGALWERISSGAVS